VTFKAASAAESNAAAAIKRQLPKQQDRRWQTEFYVPGSTLFHRLLAFLGVVKARFAGLEAERFTLSPW
jgi:hypothetical protein